MSDNADVSDAGSGRRPWQGRAEDAPATAGPRARRRPLGFFLLAGLFLALVSVAIVWGFAHSQAGAAPVFLDDQHRRLQFAALSRSAVRRARRRIAAASFPRRGEEASGHQEQETAAGAVEVARNHRRAVAHRPPGGAWRACATTPCSSCPATPTRTTNRAGWRFAKCWTPQGVPGRAEAADPGPGPPARRAAPGRAGRPRGQDAGRATAQGGPAVPCIVPVFEWAILERVRGDPGVGPGVLPRSRPARLRRHARARQRPPPGTDRFREATRRSLGAATSACGRSLAFTDRGPISRSST